jgi:hypothetical protein
MVLRLSPGWLLQLAVLPEDCMVPSRCITRVLYVEKPKEKITVGPQPSTREHLTTRRAGRQFLDYPCLYINFIKHLNLDNTVYTLILYIIIIIVFL